jgi:hypothetical protein
VPLTDIPDSASSFHSPAEQVSPIHSAKTSPHVSEAQQELSSSMPIEQTFTYPAPVVIQPTNSTHESEEEQQQELSTGTLPEPTHSTPTLVTIRPTGVVPTSSPTHATPHEAERMRQIMENSRNYAQAQAQTSAPVEQTPPPPAPKPGFFSRITTPIKNFFSSKPAPEPTVNNSSTFNLPSATNETIPLQYNPTTGNYEPTPDAFAPKTDFLSLSPEFGDDSTQAIQPEVETQPFAPIKTTPILPQDHVYNFPTEIPAVPAGKERNDFTSSSSDDLKDRTKNR